jgi:hypothetical protein
MECIVEIRDSEGNLKYKKVQENRITDHGRQFIRDMTNTQTLREEMARQYKIARTYFNWHLIELGILPKSGFIYVALGE